LVVDKQEVKVSSFYQRLLLIGSLSSPQLFLHWSRHRPRSRAPPFLLSSFAHSCYSACAQCVPLFTPSLSQKVVHSFGVVACLGKVWPPWLGLLFACTPAACCPLNPLQPLRQRRSHHPTTEESPKQSQRKFAPQTKSNVTSSALNTSAIEKTTSTSVYQLKNHIIHCRMT
jgi:hypothetical protein